ncbi:MAG: type II toxin-antitoxin system RelE/ParE family toxin [Actinomycetaceae bacterium]|nr:type II toxin-antitoxin system RelE/ParE family toxin [Actinomycetaceae bacterium]
MNTYRLSPLARQDMSQIWDYSIDHWGFEQTALYFQDMRAAFERLAASPSLGQVCDVIRPGYRRYAIGSHLVFYRARPAGVDVIRILHQRMDPTLHL